MNKISVVIVDDEKLSRDKIRDLLLSDKDFEIVAECSNGNEAVLSINEKKPDLVLLDIQMPELDGFGVIETIGIEKMPYVIFITAYNDYAIKAFEVHAFDYLLKPFDRDRFVESMKRVKSFFDKFDNKDIGERLAKLIHTLDQNKDVLKRLVIKSGGRIFFIDADRIDWIESAGNYVILHVGKEEYLYRETLKTLEDKLDENLFARIHRSKIVNMDRISELQNWSHGDYLIILKDNTELILSRNYKDNLPGLF